MPSLARLRGWLREADSARMKSPCECPDVHLFSTTLSANCLVYIPAGYLAAERALNAEDVYGVRWMAMP
eukprot:7493899-Alexandrium_andersonii.AAC.1